jgi:hypothetical protein
MDGDLVRLSVADAHERALVPHDDQCREREAPPALDHLGHAVDLDDALLELAAAGGRCPVPCHRSRVSKPSAYLRT